MISPERLDLMQRGWAALLGRLGVPPADAYPVFDRLVAAYSEPHRHYHTLEHVAEMLKVLGKLLPPSADLGAAQLAAWFHDAVYDPRATDNEERSADLMDQCLAPLGIAEAKRSLIRRLILATKSHRPDGDAVPEEVAIVDADLAILGADPGRYDRYAAAIRQEYAHVAEADYRQGRLSFLQSVLRREAIFTSPLLKPEGEAAARANLAREVQRLDEGRAAT